MTAPEWFRSRAFVGLGANLGDRLLNLQRAVELLGRHESLVLVASSRVYETEAVGPPQPKYLNAVVEIWPDTTPIGLLDACLLVESRLGRVRGERWGPRVIDLDVLAFGDLAIDEPRLQVPHPRMHERPFVLAPLLELDPDPVLPADRHLWQLRLPPRSWRGVRLFAPALRVAGPAPEAFGRRMRAQSSAKVPPASQYSPRSWSRKPSSTR